ncbi:uncharacterized protein GGS22DRAFT_164072 [Annulohypoxylon maeteangense]|uniref:uncharacterized protein n=1 Tax=Annulohypoxylon maeteangense TaxID=1927788 RepID=UPI002008B8BD|nr:uncharacterized protein GGS22DRAFT_164072 [Annulohypoxylon maeteangense]KAI0884676.1 hypothetical protein GGS22DRAFT_164072 [Annulohypoxylon maeteangense]
MGWMWSSSPSPPSKGPNSTSNPSSEPPKPSSPTKQAESEYSDPEIAKFMAQLQEEFGSKSKPAEPAQPAPPSSSSDPPPSQSSSSPSSSSSWSNYLWGATKSTPSPSTSTSTQQWSPTQLDPLSEALLPTSMSCRQAFDAAFHCNSLGGQWTSVYREGNVRTCSEHWDDFWFCMRARTLSSPQKEEAIRAHYRKKEYAKYFAPGRLSSTDVWETRTEMVQPGSVFNETLEMPDVSDDEWRRQEIERRRLVRERLAEEEEV